MKSNPEVSTAVWKRIQAELQHKIESKVWPVGSLVPSRRDLAREYQVSTLTIERAIEALSREGFLQSVGRKGTFVASEKPIEAVALPAGATKKLAVGIVATLYVMRHDHLEINNFWVRLIVQGIEGAHSDEGETTVFFNRVRPDGSVRSLEETIAIAQDYGVDGLAIIAFNQHPDEVDRAVATVVANKVPVVCVTTGAIKLPVPHVFLDGYDAGYQAAAHLHRQGCEKILYLNPYEAWWSREREEGIRSALNHAKLPTDALTVFPAQPDPWVVETDPQTLGYAAARLALASGLRPQGVICANDGAAFGYRQAAEELDLFPRRDFLIVGFDDQPQSRSEHLTSLRPSLEALGEEAARLLRLSFAGRNDRLQVRLRWRLIPRASSLSSHPSGPSFGPLFEDE